MLQSPDLPADIVCARCGEILVHLEPIAGYIYILSNASLRDLVKIGFTERSVSQRIAELSSHTGVPSPYVEVASFPVHDPCTVERLIHAELSHHRHRGDREFFKLSPERATELVRRFLNLPIPVVQTRGPIPSSDIVGGFGSARYDKTG